MEERDPSRSMRRLDGFARLVAETGTRGTKGSRDRYAWHPRRSKPSRSVPVADLCATDTELDNTSSTPAPSPSLPPAQTSALTSQQNPTAHRVRHLWQRGLPHIPNSSTHPPHIPISKTSRPGRRQHRACDLREHGHAVKARPSPAVETGTYGTHRRGMDAAKRQSPATSPELDPGCPPKPHHTRSPRRQLTARMTPPRTARPRRIPTGTAGHLSRIRTGEPRGKRRGA